MVFNGITIRGQWYPTVRLISHQQSMQEREQGKPQEQKTQTVVNFPKVIGKKFENIFIFACAFGFSCYQAHWQKK